MIVFIHHHVPLSIAIAIGVLLAITTTTQGKEATKTKASLKQYENIEQMRPSYSYFHLWASQLYVYIDILYDINYQKSVSQAFLFSLFNVIYNKNDTKRYIRIRISLPHAAFQ